MILRVLALLLCLAHSLHAVLWKDDESGCAVNLPDSPGWQPTPPVSIPGLRILVSLQNPSRGAIFGVTTLENPPTTNVNDVKTQEYIEKLLKDFGYTFKGSSTMPMAGLMWRQYNVEAGQGAQAATGVVRYTSGNGRIFAVTLLLDRGRVAAQDVELQGASGSFRLYPPVSAPVASLLPTPPTPSTGPAHGTGAPASAPVAATPPKDSASDSILPKDPIRLALFAGGAVVVIAILLAIVGGGSKKPKKPVRR